MCAIAGFVGLNANDGIMQKMLTTMARRGPDEKGTVSFDMCSLLHTRLSVIDPDGGKQPMELLWGNERYTIVYNGELYNTTELRNALEREGHIFLGHSDTEVVLRAYAQWGAECLQYFNGIFAFGVWEERRQNLFLARDRMGVKPLFYRYHNGGFLFASEIKTILAYPGVKAELDAVGVSEILLLGPGRTHGSGVFKGIYELEPGYYGSFNHGSWCYKQYWKLTDREHSESFEDTAAYVRYLVTDSIERQLVSDVPIGTFLSGGLDSSIISSVSAMYFSRQNKKLKTFSVDYVNNDKYFVPGKFQPNSDHYYIGIMQEYLNTEHSLTQLTPDELMENLKAATIARDLPGMADVDFSLLAFCGNIRKEVKVALSGECADEIFGGYPWYRDPQIRASEGFPWAQNTKLRASFLAPDILKQISPEEYVFDKYLQTINESDILPGTSEEDRRIKQLVNLNIRWFMQTLLDRKDRMSMYHGLEVRVPFCDYRIAEYLYGVPWRYKDYNNTEKGLLRYAMSDILPEEVAWRKKSPYPKTFDPRYTELVRKALSAVLKHKDAPILQIVNKESLENLLETELAWPWYGQLMGAPQTIAYMLQLNFWLSSYNVEII